MDSPIANSWVRWEDGAGTGPPVVPTTPAVSAACNLTVLHLKTGAGDFLLSHTVPGGREGRQKGREEVQLEHKAQETPGWFISEFRELLSLCDPRQATFHLGRSQYLGTKSLT